MFSGNTSGYLGLQPFLTLVDKVPVTLGSLIKEKQTDEERRITGIIIKKKDFWLKQTTR